MDSRPEAGGGHVSRSLSLARDLAAFNPIHFILDGDAGDWQERLSQSGISWESAESGNWLDQDWYGVVVDGYRFDPHEIGNWKSRAGFLVEFCDFDLPSSHADIVIGWRSLAGQLEPGVTELVGLKYALLDPAFQTEYPSKAAQQVGHIVVCFGARDGTNATTIALEALKDTIPANSETRVTVVLGGRAPHLATVRRLINEIGHGITLRIDETDMTGLLRSADLAIGAGGIGLLERMASGVPSITIATAKNQMDVIGLASDGGGTLALDERSNISSAVLADALTALIADRARRRDMADNARKLIDGQGSVRLANAITQCRTAHA